MYKDDILTTEQFLRDGIVSMIIDGDKTIKELFKNKDITLAPTNKVSEITYRFINDRVFVQIPNNIHETPDIEATELLRDIEYNLSNYVRKAIEENADINSELLNKDTTNKVFSSFNFAVTKEEKDEYKNTEKSADGSGECEIKLEEYDKDSKYEYQDTEWELDKDTQQEVSKTRFMTDKEIDISDRYKDMARKLIKSFKGYQGRLSTTNPTKRLRNKAIASELSDKIYENRKAMNGKKLENINFLIRILYQ